MMLHVFRCRRSSTTAGCLLTGTRNATEVAPDHNHTATTTINQEYQLVASVLLEMVTRVCGRGRIAGSSGLPSSVTAAATGPSDDACNNASAALHELRAANPWTEWNDSARGRVAGWPPLLPAAKSNE